MIPDAPEIYNHDSKPRTPDSTHDIDKRPTERKLPPLKQTSTTDPASPPSTPKNIIATTLLEEDLPISTMMGFSRFTTTKGKKHVDYGGVHLIKRRTYRQYMNRPGGFNRPLDG